VKLPPAVHMRAGAVSVYSPFLSMSLLFVAGYRPAALTPVTTPLA